MHTVLDRVYFFDILETPNTSCIQCIVYKLGTNTYCTSYSFIIHLYNSTHRVCQYSNSKLIYEGLLY